MKERILTIYASIISIIGFILQLTEINTSIKKIFLILCIITLIALLIISIMKKETVNRKQLIKYGNKIILNTKEKIILFGGDMSWVDDYIDSIKRIYSENKTIEIFFPRSKYDNCDNNEEILERIIELRSAGAKVFSFKVDYGLRCIMIDPDSYNSNDNMEIMVTDRFFTHPKKASKNKYIYKYFKYSNKMHKNICKSYISNYHYIKENCDTY